MFRKLIFALLLTLALTATSGRAAEAARIESHDGLIWADVDCGGRTLHFVVDTGAVSSCVDLAAAKRLRLPLGNVVNVFGVDGRATGYECRRFEATVGGMRLPEQVVALDLSGPARGCSERIDGLIGADFFRGKVVRIDYRRGVLSRVVRPSPAAGMRLRFANGAICVPVAVNGVHARWTRLDTGCTAALVWCGAGCCQGKGMGKSVALTSSTKGGLQADVAVGRESLHTVPVTIRERSIFPGEAGLLGNAALLEYGSVTMDGIGNRLVLGRGL